MEAELARLREGFFTAARERLNQMNEAMDRLAQAPFDTEAFRKLRLHFFWFSCWGAMYGCPSIAEAGHRGDEEMTRELLVGGAREVEAVHRWRGYLRTINAGTVESESGSRQQGGQARFLLFTRRPERFASREEGRCWFDSVSTDFADSRDKAMDLLAPGTVTAVALDLSVPIHELLDLVKAIRGLGSATRPVPPIVGIAETLGILDRYHLTQSGVNATLPISATCADFGRAVQKCLRETEMARGTVFFLGLDAELRDRLVKDLGAEGIRVFAFVEFSLLLRTWLEVQPDLILVNAVKWGAGGLRVVKDMRDDPHANRLPIVVIVDKADMETRQSLFDAGADDFLLHPYLPSELAAKVRDPIDLRRLLKEREQTCGEEGV